MKEKNILDLFRSAVGQTEVPERYFRWACYSLVASAVQDRVWYQQFKWARLYPNLYVFLIGPSGVGKGVALSFANQFVTKRMGMFMGEITKPALIEWFSGGDDPESGQPKLLLVTPELANNIEKGQMANRFVKAMTDWYSKTGENRRQESTRTMGYREYDPPLVNWQAGTTAQWMGEVFDRAAVMSGALGRIFIINADYDPERRVFRPMAPNDYEAIILEIRQRIKELERVEGPFKMSGDAYELAEHWYNTSRAPSMKELMPFFSRRMDHVFKLAMVSSLCEGVHLMLKLHHIEAGTALFTETMRSQANLISDVIASGKNEAYRMVAQLIKQAGSMSRTSITRALSYKYKVKQIDEAIYDLLAQNFIIGEKQITRGRPRSLYTWNEKRFIK